jgi:hypothetical protein
MQGSVQINEKNWSWNGKEWIESPTGCNPNFASSIQCIVPFEYSNERRPVTGAVHKNGLIPLGRDSYIWIQIPDAKEGFFKTGLLVNVKDECPACKPSGVDILRTDKSSYSGYNHGSSAIATNVIIWLWVPIAPIDLPISDPYR